MAKTIKITHDDKEYTLEYNRASCQTMESNGFVLDDIDKRPATMIPLLFSGAFLKNHRFVKADTVNEIFESLGDKEKLIQKLGEMYAENLLAFFDEDESDKKGKNSKWEADF